MLIGKLVEESGCSRDTIRYYEKRGLIESVGIDRHANNYKNYPPQTVQRLKHIAELKATGFTLTEILHLLEDFNHPDTPCAGLPKKLNNKIAQINEKILSLENIRQSLLGIKASCNGQCGSSNGLPECMS